MPSVVTRHNGDMVFETQVGEHKILNDVMPTPEWGGKGRHPTPPDYFVTSLSSCIAAFVVQYCQRAGIDSRDMSVEVAFEKGEKPAHMKDFVARIALPHGTVGERMEALKRAAEYCTVHETITRMTEGLAIEVRDATSS